MRIVVVSDSHNNYHVLERVRAAQPQASLFLHLGDGAREFEDLSLAYPQDKMVGVRGNCDWSADLKGEELVFCREKKIFLTHGHLYNVKNTTARLLERARLLGADICCFGHTHTPLAAYEEGVYLLNPGSVSHPRAGKPSYGIIDLTDAGIATKIVYL